jgi:hypothetical protein
LRRSGRSGPWPEIIADPDSLTETEIAYDGKRFVVHRLLLLLDELHRDPPVAELILEALAVLLVSEQFGPSPRALRIGSRISNSSRRRKVGIQGVS